MKGCGRVFSYWVLTELRFFYSMAFLAPEMVPWWRLVCCGAYCWRRAHTDFRPLFPAVDFLRNFYVPTYTTYAYVQKNKKAKHGDFFSIPLLLMKTNIDLH